jgi:hypothetical protein
MPRVDKSQLRADDCQIDALHVLDFSHPSRLYVIELASRTVDIDLNLRCVTFLIFAAVKKSKTLPRMSSAPDFTVLAERIKNLLSLPAQGRVTFSNDGAKTWDRWVFSLVEPTDGKLAAAVERSKPNALRVALIYALLDEGRLDPAFGGTSCSIDKPHVEAAIELVTRSRQSVKWFLNSRPEIRFAPVLGAYVYKPH